MVVQMFVAKYSNFYLWPKFSSLFYWIENIGNTIAIQYLFSKVAFGIQKQSRK